MTELFCLWGDEQFIHFLSLLSFFFLQWSRDATIVSYFSSSQCRVINSVRPSSPSQLRSFTFPLLKSHFPPGGVTLSSAPAKMTERERPANKIYPRTPPSIPSTFRAEIPGARKSTPTPPPLGPMWPPQLAPFMTSVHPIPSPRWWRAQLAGNRWLWSCNHAPLFLLSQKYMFMGKQEYNYLHSAQQQNTSYLTVSWYKKLNILRCHMQSLCWMTLSYYHANFYPNIC